MRIMGAVVARCHFDNAYPDMDAHDDFVAC